MRKESSRKNLFVGLDLAPFDVGLRASKSAVENSLRSDGAKLNGQYVRCRQLQRELVVREYLRCRL